MLHDWRFLLDRHIKSVLEFLESCSPICYEYNNSKKQNQNKTFNVFTLVSDLYYRENFHSDILRFFLDSKEIHNHKDKYLFEFIKMLQALGRQIDLRDYQDAIAIREEGKIDILIKSDTSKHAIIVENKMNDAGDMPRQLPRYFDFVSPHYQIDAIIYLPLNYSKSPDMSDWTERDKANVCPLLNIIPAYDKSRINLLDNWLCPIEKITNNIDVLSTLRQYSKLIRLLNANAMDTVILEKFYEEIKEGDNLKTAQSIRNMLNELPCYMARRVFETYRNRCAPFSKIFLWSPNDPSWAVFEGDILGIHVKLDIECAEEGYNTVFKMTNDSIHDQDIFLKIITNVESFKGFSFTMEEPDRVSRKFGFFAEAGLYSFINSLLTELSCLNKRYL